jgi:hypothetical protein
VPKINTIESACLMPGNTAFFGWIYHDIDESSWQTSFAKIVDMVKILLAIFISLGFGWFRGEHAHKHDEQSRKGCKGAAVIILRTPKWPKWERESVCGVSLRTDNQYALSLRFGTEGLMGYNKHGKLKDDCPVYWKWCAVIDTVIFGDQGCGPICMKTMWVQLFQFSFSGSPLGLNYSGSECTSNVHNPSYIMIQIAAESKHSRHEFPCSIV